MIEEKAFILQIDIMKASTFAKNITVIMRVVSAYHSIKMEGFSWEKVRQFYWKM